MLRDFYVQENHKAPEPIRKAGRESKPVVPNATEARPLVTSSQTSA
jgi:hypothetical protein